MGSKKGTVTRGNFPKDTFFRGQTAPAKNMAVPPSFLNLAFYRAELGPLSERAGRGVNFHLIGGIEREAREHGDPAGR